GADLRRGVARRAPQAPTEVGVAHLAAPGEAVDSDSFDVRWRTGGLGGADDAHAVAAADEAARQLVDGVLDAADVGEEAHDDFEDRERALVARSCRPRPKLRRGRCPSGRAG